MQNYTIKKHDISTDLFVSRTEQVLIIIEQSFVSLKNKNMNVELNITSRNHLCM